MRKTTYLSQNVTLKGLQLASDHKKTTYLSQNVTIPITGYGDIVTGYRCRLASDHKKNNIFVATAFPQNVTTPLKGQFASFTLCTLHTMIIKTLPEQSKDVWHCNKRCYDMTTLKH